MLGDRSPDGPSVLDLTSEVFDGGDDDIELATVVGVLGADAGLNCFGAGGGAVEPLLGAVFEADHDLCVRGGGGRWRWGREKDGENKVEEGEVNLVSLGGGERVL